MPDALDPIPLLRHLSDRGVRHIIIGGFAVVAHGHVRASKDLDIVPEPSRENLERLVSALTDANAADLAIGDFDPLEIPLSATRIDDLEQGGNFRLTTDLGALDIMQWASGIETDALYHELAGEALEGDLEGLKVRVCGLEHLRAMKRAAGRPQDLEDLNRLEGVGR
jgi:hypothetical protein